MLLKKPEIFMALLMFFAKPVLLLHCYSIVGSNWFCPQLSNI